ncbi:hypothetical protein HYV50_05830 [Candidatus Pacearchaeota archaeon]|nr:hypothetical protein [Candidatus Pacearchaeota archaeon]
MKKRVLVGLFFMALIVMINFSSAQSEGYVDEIRKAITCLDNQVSKSSQLGFEEAVFSALAKVPNAKVARAINTSKGPGDDCWPREGCRARETAQTILAKKALNQDRKNAMQWLFSRSGTARGLTWYLQITIKANEPKSARCAISYDNSKEIFDVRADMKIEGSPGTCFEISRTGYWLKIKDSCVDKEFLVSCDGNFDNFLTNLLYEKGTSGIIYVSQKTESKSSGGITKEKINAKCFKEGDNCDYEATLWATSALYDAGNDSYIDFVPYLRVFAEDNEKYFPSAFLMFILGQDFNDEQYEKLIRQRTAGHWEIPGSPYSKYYDSALAILGLGGAESADVSDTLIYLFEGEGKQTANGCWNNDNIKDTAFLVYSTGWWSGRTGVSPPPGGEEPPIDEISPNSCFDGYWYDENKNKIDTTTEKGYCHLIENGCCPGGYQCEFSAGNESESGCVLITGIYDPEKPTNCEEKGRYCAPDRISCISAGGQPDETAECAVFSKICCTVEVPELPSCFALEGNVCQDDEECSSPVVESSDGACCAGTCRKKAEEPKEPQEPVPPKPVEGRNWTWIIILSVLILLLIVAIVYRNKLKLWWYKTRGRAKITKIPPGPGIGPMVRREPPRFGPLGTMRPSAMPSIRKPVTASIPKAKTEKEKELEETLKKLKKMSE